MEQSINKKYNYSIIIGNIYTANISNDFVESVVLEGNKIVFLGPVEEAHAFLEKNKIHSDKIRYIKLKLSQVMIPGFIDSHVHPLLGVLAKTSANLSECQNLQEALEKIQHYISLNPDVEYIRGMAYNDSFFTQDTPAHYSLLDQISSEIPIAIMRYDAHAYWCNSAAMKIAGVTKDSISPEGGIIDRDQSGEPIGVFHDCAMDLLKKAMPKLDFDKKADLLVEAMKYLLSFGITAFMDAAVKIENCQVYEKVYKNEEISRTLPRASLSILTKSTFVDPESSDEVEIETIEDLIIKIDKFFSQHRIRNWEKKGNRLKIDAVKLFIDGVFESGTAMFSKCKCHDELEIKAYTYKKEELQKIIDYFYNLNIQIHTHCIGDLATKMVIDAIENARLTYKNVENVARNYIAHLQLVKPEDIKRMKDLNIYGNMSPFWFQEDKFTSQFEDLIGAERVQDVYPIKTLSENGICIGFGSDWPVSTLSPLEGIEVAVIHRALGTTYEIPSYLPEQEISLFEAIKAYTINSAEILGLEKLVGTIEIGKLGDFVVLDKNIFEMDPWEIHTASVSMTLVDGEIVYDNYSI